MWEGILDLCAEIEKEPRAVYSVIQIVKEQYKDKMSEGSSTVRTYRTVFTRIYIILYYRHAEETGSIFETVVYPPLADNMGIYAGETLSSFIRPEIEHILKDDKDVEQKWKEKQKEVELVFANADYSGADSKGYTTGSTQSQEAEVLLATIRELKSNLSQKEKQLVEASNINAQQATIIKKLETENARLTAENKGLREELENKKEEPKDKGRVLEVSSDEIIIELLTPFLKSKDDQEAKDFLEELKEKDDIAIAELVFEHKSAFHHKIRKIELWRILHATKLYTASDRNFSKALRVKGWT